MELATVDVPETTSAANRPPRPWLAVLLSLLQPGLGHAYLWRLRAALGFTVLFFLVGAAGILAIAALPGVSPMLAATAAALAVNIGVALHARSTARTGAERRRPSRGRLALVLVAWFLVLGYPHDVMQEWTRRNVIEAYRIPSGAMEPSILVGDYLFARARRGAPVERDAPYTFRRGESVIVMRVVGLAGDTLAMRGGTLVRNGRPVDEPYARMEGAPYGAAEEFAWQRSHLADPSLADTYVPTADDWGPLVVPPESVFVLGDNRHEARDSRLTGPVAEHDVLGRATEVYFSRAPEGGIRWDRIGVRLD